LPLVEKPSRYLGSEINRIVKDHEDIRLQVALAFPDLYEIGTSHFGIQILYHILNGQADIAAERVFTPGLDMVSQLRKTGNPLTSLETQKPLKQFDMLGFSLLYEMNYTNVLLMLTLSGIPFFTRQRDLSFPMIVGGGPCTVNPEPVSDFFDAMVIGDGETVILSMAREMIHWKEGGRRDKDDLLNKWSKIEGVYIPAFYKASYDASGFQELRPVNAGAENIKRAIVPDLDTAPFPDAPLVPFGKPIHDRLRLEISRGCTRGCRFCQAGMIYRPVRERAPETLLGIYEKAFSATGYEDLSLLSLSTGDYTSIAPLMTELMARCGKERVAVSLPSIRAGSLSAEIMELIKKVRKTGFTIAPEAGSQRLRDVINKNITETDILKTVQDAFALGWKVIKLYFMIGLPTERDQDLHAIVDLVNILKAATGSKGHRGKINVSVATFIPKSHTPFQWASQNELAESKEKIQWVKAHLKKPGVHFKWQNPQVSQLEGLWARGDRRLCDLLVSAFGRGCVFDGWSDHFKYDDWMAAAEEIGVDVDFYTTRQRALAEPLPWDHVDTGVTTEYLKREWDRAVKEELTTDCRNGECSDCGVCDFKRVEPRIFESAPKRTTISQRALEPGDPVFPRLEVVYSKRGPAKFFGHLELMSIFTRALRRAAIPVCFSKGFHPKPKISFEDPLPVGVESDHEIFWINLAANIRPETVGEKLGRQLPRGLSVVSCRLAGKKGKARGILKTTYKIVIKDGIFDQKRLKSFFDKPEWVILRKNRKNREIRIDLKKMVLSLERIDSRSLRMVILSAGGKTTRPAEVMTHLFNMSEVQVKTATIVKERVEEAGNGNL